MDLEQFAEHYRLKTQKDACGDIFIAGSRVTPHHIFDNYDGRLGICLMFPDESPARWTYAKAKGQMAGLVVKQDGRSEGTMLFDPENKVASRAAIRITGARVRRILTPEQKAALATRLAAARAK